ncbi:MAG: hypothetical protein UR28_C0021G0016 [Candidatus Peregrinibacteria bacterium GW2011_GWF2_33_10]|nr:MAG: hypothetical protein UR28_C0021G0016 [Candidatus Peregrinibacteria bacterium GW2011_GWF2_33_10]OGJ44373.1 MAG: hypothetical protein A2263_05795 [Candidatus Peregrinibacteria bacterium RIFOXYA2_FULL_33_21]OGJ46392.1 MAG: hypothetical protein A2272_01665 [Candidatus Peregrinibacteria bacterium RIFOXYA12_FULL_33_12]OGJ50168.1 MAG: hypothetical protein A2307_03285 [Candidatus Peregrinibacteria bacterium RIFOXYB2_FULL_33_20]
MVKKILTLTYIAIFLFFYSCSFLNEAQKSAENIQKEFTDKKNKVEEASREINEAANSVKEAADATSKAVDNVFGALDALGNVTQSSNAEPSDTNPSQEDSSK